MPAVVAKGCPQQGRDRCSCDEVLDDRSRPSATSGAGSGHDAAPPFGTQRYRLLRIDAAGKFVPEIVPSSDGALEAACDKAYLP